MPRIGARTPRDGVRARGEEGCAREAPPGPAGRGDVRGRPGQGLPRHGDRGGLRIFWGPWGVGPAESLSPGRGLSVAWEPAVLQDQVVHVPGGGPSYAHGKSSFVFQTI